MAFASCLRDDMGILARSTMVALPWKRTGAGVEHPFGGSASGPGDGAQDRTVPRQKRRRIVTQHRWIRNLLGVFACLLVLAPGAAVRAQAAAAASRVEALRAGGPVADPLIVQVQGSLATRAQAGALVRALSRHSGLPLTLRHGPGALAHWRALRRGEPAQAVLEEAPFVDYRLARGGFRLLAQERRDARFAVIVAPGTLVSSPADLRTRRLAVVPAPALAALRLLQLFADPLQAPVLVPLAAGDPVQRWIASGRVDGAMVSMARAEASPGLRVVLVSDALPGPGLLLADDVAPGRREALRGALLGLDATADGAAALQAMAMSGFRSALAEDYQGAARLLRGTWPAP
jgi:phosphonate transport system substrate-binding protein